MRLFDMVIKYNMHIKNFKTDTVVVASFKIFISTLHANIETTNFISIMSNTLISGAPFSLVSLLDVSGFVKCQTFFSFYDRERCLQISNYLYLGNQQY